jgi:glycosyl transferase, family 25
MVLPVFLINLDRSPDRLAFMRAEAERIGLQFERVQGVDGTTVPDDLRPQFLKPDGSIIGRLSVGEVGCYASHLTVHQRILAESSPCAIVLEDDARLMANLMESAQAAIEAAPRGWDIIHLSSVFTRPVYAIADLPDRSHLVRYTRPPRNTAGYIISRSGAAKMLRPAPRARPIDMDMKIAHERGLDILGVYPSPVIWGDHMPSTMVGESGRKRTASRYLAFRGFLYGVRKLGPVAYAQCQIASLRGAVPVVKGHLATRGAVLAHPERHSPRAPHASQRLRRL